MDADPALPARIVEAVSAHYGVRISRLRGPGRCHWEAEPRHVAALLLRWAGLSWPRIGAWLGGRHHTTAMDGARRAQADYADDVRELAGALGLVAR